MLLLKTFRVEGNIWFLLFYIVFFLAFVFVISLPNLLFLIYSSTMLQVFDILRSHFRLCANFPSVITKMQKI